MLEAEQARLRDQIQSFQKEKSELEFILETHRAHCGPSTVSDRTVGNAPSAGVTARSLTAGVSSADTSLSVMTEAHYPGE